MPFLRPINSVKALKECSELPNLLQNVDSVRYHMLHDISIQHSKLV